MADIAVEAPRGDHSLADLRTMLRGDTAPAAPAAAAPKAEAAPAAAEPAAEPAPASEPESTQEANEGQERGADGKFKPKAAAAAAEPDEAVPAGVQKRIDKAVRAQREAERRATEAEAKLANQGPRPGEAVKPANNAPPAAATPKPDPAKPETYKAFGTTYEAYLEALTEWKVDQRRSKDAAEAETERRATAQRTATESHNARVEKAKADPERSDWDEVMAAGQNVPISQALLDFIRTSEHGPETAYYLLKNPDQMNALLKLAPILQVAEAGAIAKAQFAKPAEPVPPAPAKKPLPKPAAAVGGAAGAKQADLNDPKLPFAEFKRLANAELKRG